MKREQTEEEKRWCDNFLVPKAEPNKRNSDPNHAAVVRRHAIEEYQAKIRERDECIIS